MDNLFLELNFKEDFKEPIFQKEVKILPVGEEVVGADGRCFEIKGEEVYGGLKTSPADLMLDLNHQYEGEAMGWFKNPILKEDGIYADLELTPKGSELVKNKAYRYLSPAFRAIKDEGKLVVKSLHSIGLVNLPNLSGLALNNQFETLQSNNERIQMENELKGALEKLEALSKDISELKTQNQTLRNENEKLLQERAMLEKNHQIQRIEQAIANKELLPSRKEELLELNAETLDKFLEIYKIEAKNAISDSSLQTSNMEENKNFQSELSLEIKRQLGINQ
ncbi:phage protease [Helicobacter sp. 13S00477-4]|uniref:phage protease n=1 Tax=Helicobacter sp. 13S00477-4 TaxID=1905759 RepID=UPI000BA5511E|nr:phage protease [Helicobacter sp. 13S00477-4]PAF51291.1 hypothetical protein BKH44_06180 [Helicobacter sp. 13S00477-4]